MSSLNDKLVVKLAHARVQIQGLEEDLATTHTSADQVSFITWLRHICSLAGTCHAFNRKLYEN